MSTLLALSASQSIHAFQQNSLWMRWGYAGVFAAVCEAWLSPSEVTDEQRSPFRKVQSCFSKLLAPKDTHPKSLPAVIHALSRTVLFPDAEQRQG
jgi:hypothetical protein